MCSIPLRDGDGTVHPAGRVEEHAMVVEGRWRVERVGHVDEEGVRCVDGERRRSVGGGHVGSRRRGEITHGQVLLTPMTRRGKRPSGFAFST